MKQKEDKSGKETPLMKQYNDIKSQHPDAIILFRVGDFYETFGQDAVQTASILGIVLTRRANGSAQFVELAGFPYHSLDAYLPKLVRAGFRVAICDQLEDAKLTKSIVKRGVTELITPGLAYSDKILDQNKNNFLCCLHIENEKCGISFLDISTGEFLVAEGDSYYIENLIARFSPNEILYERHKRNRILELTGENYYIYPLDDWAFRYEYGLESLTRQFSTDSVKGFGIDNLHLGIASCGPLLYYLKQTRHDRLQHLNTVKRIDEKEYVWLDEFTFRNLELIVPLSEKGKTLFDVIHGNVTPMGTRMLKRWIAMPLKNIPDILRRQECVQYFIENPSLGTRLQELLSRLGDMERLISKSAAQRINPRELIQLNRTLEIGQQIKEMLSETHHPILEEMACGFLPCLDLTQRLNQLNPDAPVQLQKGNVFGDNINRELDDLRKLAYHGKDYLVEIQHREAAATGISSLKIGYTQVYGYYLEVTHTHKSKVPPDWIRKQTLTTAERYVTPELKEYEEKILGAEEKIGVIEGRLFAELVTFVTGFTAQIQKHAHLSAQLDCLAGFAAIASSNDYTRPVLNEGFALQICEGRHPVIERQLKEGDEYISNSLELDSEYQQIMMITGPNMSGKSALLRQTALLVLMAQIGCYVPAKSATIGIVDKIFTRVGASDNISSGESTFMVEMNETASILNNLSERSLILLDEIGRGTATYDGISIAWAIAEYIHQHSHYRVKTLFATHYHELNDMSRSFPRIKNYHVTVKESDNKIIFLRKLEAGGSEHSFGIHVARMAGMPKQVVARSAEILKKLEKQKEPEPADTMVDSKGRLVVAQSEKDYQLSFFQLNDPMLEQIRNEIISTDIDTLTPVEALLKLNEIKKLLGK